MTQSSPWYPMTNSMDYFLSGRHVDAPTWEEVLCGLENAENKGTEGYTSQGERIIRTYEENAAYLHETVVKGRDLSAVADELGLEEEVLSDALENPDGYRDWSIFEVWSRSGIPVMVKLERD